MRVRNFLGALGLAVYLLTLPSTSVAQEETVWKQSVAAAAKAHQQGRYKEAEEHLLAALVEAEKFGGKDLRLTATLSNLGRFYNGQKQYGEAEKFFKRSLDIVGAALRSRGPPAANAWGLGEKALLSSMTNLAVVYENQEEFGKAETIYKRVFSIQRRTIGLDHLDVAQTVRSLALIKKGQGKYSAAVKQYKRVLTIRKKALGEEHPGYIQSLDEMASLHELNEDYGKAEQLYRESLALREKTLGADHPRVVRSRAKWNDVKLKAEAGE